MIFILHKLEIEYYIFTRISVLRFNILSESLNIQSVQNKIMGVTLIVCQYIRPSVRNLVQKSKIIAKILVS